MIYLRSFSCDVSFIASASADRNRHSWCPDLWDVSPSRCLWYRQLGETIPRVRSVHSLSKVAVV